MMAPVVRFGAGLTVSGRRWQGGGEAPVLRVDVDKVIRLAMLHRLAVAPCRRYPAR